MASEFTLSDDQMRAVAQMALSMVKEGFAAAPAAAPGPGPSTMTQPTGVVAYSSFSAADYQTVVATSRAPAPPSKPAEELRVGAYTPGSFADWAAPLQT